MTRRDTEILEFINRFGRVNIDQISKYFGLSQGEGLPGNESTEEDRYGGSYKSFS